VSYEQSILIEKFSGIPCESIPSNGRLGRLNLRLMKDNFEAVSYKSDAAPAI